MEAKVEANGELVIVRLSGQLDYETAEPFQSNCLSRLQGRKVIFNMEDLRFVGSSGIGQFVQTLHKLVGLKDTGLKFCSVSSEFRRVFAASDIRTVEIYEDESGARMAYHGHSILPVNAAHLNEAPEPVILVEEFGGHLNQECEIVED